MLPRPVNGSEELYLIIERMCRYEPDERYQSMDEVLDDLEKLIFHSDTHYQREHKDASLAVGSLLLFLGTIAWKLTFKPELAVDLSKMTYIFLALSVGKWVLKLFKKDVIFISMIILGAGIYLMVSSGFSWVKLLFLLCITFSSGDFAGIFAGTILTAAVVSFVTGQSQQILNNSQDYRWAAVTLLSLAAVMIIQYIVLQERDYIITSLYLKKDRYWLVVFMIYAALLLYGICTNGKTADIYCGFFGERLTSELMTYDLRKVGAIGMGVSLVWIIRGKVLAALSEHKYV